MARKNLIAQCAADPQRCAAAAILQRNPGHAIRAGAGIEAALRALQTYTWPGNVRELRNAIDFALTVGSGPALLRDDLPPHVLRGAAPPLPGDAPASGDSPSSAEASVPASDKDSAGAVPTMEEAERELIQRALSATGGNKLQAARMLGISRHRLYDSLRRFRIEDAEA